MFEPAMKLEKKKAGMAFDARNINAPVRRENRTGIPTQLKDRLEQSTGVSLDDVRVHYNSALPARLDALAYAKGNHVEIGPGQESHLPHELGHVVQQKLGAVRANAMHSSGVALNTDPGLERQADEIGAGKGIAIFQRMVHNVVQRCDPPGADAAGQSRLPDWLKARFVAGQKFDADNRPRYPYNEVEVSTGGKNYRVDSYVPGKEIISRKNSQLERVQIKTGLGYLNELKHKYPSSAKITDSPFNPKALRGTVLSGDPVLEVPVQDKPVPKEILDAANEKGITIRDVNGRGYN